MAEEKAFAATPSRIRKARQDGDIPHLPEMLALVACCTAWFMLWHVLEAMANAMAMLLRQSMQLLGSTISEGSSPYSHFTALWTGVLSTLLISLGAMLGVSMVVTIVTAGLFGGIGMKPLKFQLSKMAPSANLKRMFSKETLFSAGRALGMTVLILGTAGYGFFHAVGLFLSTTSLPQLTFFAQSTVQDSVNHVMMLGSFFALVEARSALAQWQRKLRMDYSEMKREYREQSGDPHQRSQRKRRHRRLLRDRKTAIQKATVIVTNPTHIAIALCYDPPDISVPIVVARAADAAAAEVRKIARAADVPLLEAVSLARLLYAKSEEGEAIPLESYALVAPLIASALEIRSRSGARKDNDR